MILVVMMGVIAAVGFRSGSGTVAVGVLLCYGFALSWFAAHQPVTAAVEATRALLPGQPAAAAVTTSLAWSTILVGVVAPLVVWSFRRPT